MPLNPGNLESRRSRGGKRAALSEISGKVGRDIVVLVPRGNENKAEGKRKKKSSGCSSSDGEEERPGTNLEEIKVQDRVHEETPPERRMNRTVVVNPGRGCTMKEISNPPSHGVSTSSVTHTGEDKKKKKD